MNLSKNRGFTLIELLVVVAIIGMLSSVVLASLGGARDKAKTARALSDLKQFQLAITLLEDDTNETVGHHGAGGCPITTGDNEYFLDENRAGLIATDGLFTGWKGPYIPSMPADPWGNKYIFDDDFTCVTGASGCDGATTEGSKLRVIYSGGPNGSGINAYDADNVVAILCARP